MLNVVIPCAGNGQRFVDAGYNVPKPFIPINCEPMICRVVKSLNISGFYHFIARSEHIDGYSPYRTFSKLANPFKVYELGYTTDGAARTVLIAEKDIDNDNELIIANSDQIIEWDSSAFLAHARQYDGCILTFNADHPKWSYAKVENDLVTEVAEKKVISNTATVGVYYWKRGSDFVKYAKQMIDKDIRTNNEFYVCPVFNEAIQDNKRIGVFPVQQMWGVGTPEDLEKFIEINKNSTNLDGLDSTI